MALLGPDGLRDLAHRNMMACQKAKEVLAATPGVRIVHDAHHFNEFAIEVQGSAARAWITSTATASSVDWTWPMVRRNDEPIAHHHHRPNHPAGHRVLVGSTGAVGRSRGGECMSHLFNHNGAENTGYSQPTPLACETEPTVPQGLIRSNAARWPRLSEPEMVRHYTGCRRGISALTQVSTRWVRAR